MAKISLPAVSIFSVDAQPAIADPAGLLFILSIWYVMFGVSAMAAVGAVSLRWSHRRRARGSVFDLDALSSAVALNLGFDVLLTTIATGLHRLLALQLRGFERAQPRQVWRRFLKSPAHVRVALTEVVVELPRRAHNPILMASGLLDERTIVPWWNGHQLWFEIP